MRLNRIKDISGQQFGRLLALWIAGKNRGKRNEYLWSCQCDCGAIVLVSAGHLKTGNTKSCGCLDREVFLLHATLSRAVVGKLNTVHGHLAMASEVLKLLRNRRSLRKSQPEQRLRLERRK